MYIDASKMIVAADFKKQWLDKKNRVKLLTASLNFF